MNNIIKVKVISIKVNKKLPVEIRLLILSHFGKNPIKGGIPPNEKKFIIKLIFKILF